MRVLEGGFAPVKATVSPGGRNPGQVVAAFVVTTSLPCKGL